MRTVVANAAGSSATANGRCGAQSASKVVVVRRATLTTGSQQSQAVSDTSSESSMQDRERSETLRADSDSELQTANEADVDHVAVAMTDTLMDLDALAVSDMANSVDPELLARVQPACFDSGNTLVHDVTYTDSEDAAFLLQCVLDAGYGSHATGRRPQPKSPGGKSSQVATSTATSFSEVRIAQRAAIRKPVSDLVPVSRNGPTLAPRQHFWINPQMTRLGKAVKKKYWLLSRRHLAETGL